MAPPVYTACLRRATFGVRGGTGGGRREVVPFERSRAGPTGRRPGSARTDGAGEGSQRGEEGDRLRGLGAGGCVLRHGASRTAHRVTSNGEGRVERREVRSEKRGGVRSGCLGGRVAGCAGSDHGTGSRPRTPGWRREGGRGQGGRPYAGGPRTAGGQGCVQPVGAMCSVLGRMCSVFAPMCSLWRMRCSVEEGERAEGRGVRRDAEEGEGAKTGFGSIGRLREGSPRDSGPGHHERGGRGQAGTHKGRPYMEKTAGDAGMTGMCPPRRANVSSLAGNA